MQQAETGKNVKRPSSRTASPSPRPRTSVTEPRNNVYSTNREDSSTPTPLSKANSSNSSSRLSTRVGKREQKDNSEELFRRLMAKIETNDQSVALLLDEVKKLSNKLSEQKESLDGTNSTDNESSTDENETINTTHNFVKVFSKVNQQYLYINTSTGQILNECESLKNGWECFFLGDQDKYVWVQQGSKHAVFNAPSFDTPQKNATSVTQIPKNESPFPQVLEVIEAPHNLKDHPSGASNSSEQAINHQLKNSHRAITLCKNETSDEVWNNDSTTPASNPPLAINTAKIQPQINSPSLLNPLPSSSSSSSNNLAKNKKNIDETPEEKYRILLTPRASAAQAKAISVQALQELNAQRYRSTKSRGYWDIATSAFSKLALQTHEQVKSREDDDNDRDEHSQARIELPNLMSYYSRSGGTNSSSKEEEEEESEKADINDKTISDDDTTSLAPKQNDMIRRNSMRISIGNKNGNTNVGSGTGNTMMTSDGSVVVEEFSNVRKPIKGFLMFYPDGSVKLTWDVMIVLPLLFFLAIMTPFFLCFGYDPRRIHHPNLLIFEALIDAVFLLDIILNFRTGYLTNDNEIEFDPFLIAINYLKGWFWIDVFSGFPYSIVMASSNNERGGEGWLSSMKVLKVSKLLRALRVFRFLKLTRIFNTAKIFHLFLDPRTKEWVEDALSQYAGSIQVKFVQVVCLLALLCHVMGCFWVMVAREGDRQGDETWLSDGTVVEEFTFKSTKHGPAVTSIYIAAFYFCMTTMTSVGYGDLGPVTDRERTFTIFLEGIGCVMYALVVATLTSVIMSKDANARAMSEKLENIRSYVANRGFKPTLARKLRAYFRHFYSERMAIDETQILKDCSTGLRMEVSSFLVSNLMDQVSLFRILSPIYWARMLSILRPCLFAGGEVVCTQGEESTEMFIILNGGCRAFTTGLKDSINSMIHVESQIHNIGLNRTSLSKNDDFHHDNLELKEKEGSNENNSSHVLKKRNTNQDIHNISDVKLIDTDDDEDDDEDDEVKSEKRQKEHKNFNNSFHSKNSSNGFKLNKSQQNISGRQLKDKLYSLTQDVAESMGSKDMESFEIARFVVTGGVLNSLAALGVWPQCVESVVALEMTEAYVVNADDFSSLFKDDPKTWDNLKKRAVLTGFAMVPDPEAPTEYGMPVHVLPYEEIAEKEAQFEVKLMEESRRRWIAMERRKSGALALSSRVMKHSSQSSESNARPPNPRAKSVNGGGDWETLP